MPAQAESLTRMYSILPWTYSACGTWQYESEGHGFLGVLADIVTICHCALCQARNKTCALLLPTAIDSFNPACRSDPYSCSL